MTAVLGIHSRLDVDGDRPADDSGGQACHPGSIVAGEGSSALIGRGAGIFAPVVLVGHLHADESQARMKYVLTGAKSLIMRVTQS